MVCREHIFCSIADNSLISVHQNDDNVQERIAAFVTRCTGTLLQITGLKDRRNIAVVVDWLIYIMFQIIVIGHCLNSLIDYDNASTIRTPEAMKNCRFYLVPKRGGTA